MLSFNITEYSKKKLLKIVIFLQEQGISTLQDMDKLQHSLGLPVGRPKESKWTIEFGEIRDCDLSSILSRIHLAKLRIRVTTLIKKVKKKRYKKKHEATIKLYISDISC